ncbi:MAG: hypothetical protein ABL889_19640 [Terricaulis sp.]
MPTPTYIEGPEGPQPVDVVEWIEFSTRIPSLTPGSVPRFVDVKEDIVAWLQAAHCVWEIRKTTWSVERIFRSENVGFTDEAVDLVRIMNPFGPK